MNKEKVQWQWPSMTVIYENHLEIIFCVSKYYFCYMAIKNLGWLYGVIGILTFLIIKDYFFKYYFKLERLSTNDLLLLGFENSQRYNMISLFFFQSTLDVKKLRDRLVENGIKQNSKLRMKLVKFYGSYYWKETEIEEAKKRVRILSECFSSKEDVVTYCTKEMNNHIRILEEIPYEIQLASYDSGAALIFKLDHSFSDGLGMVTFSLTQVDNLTDDVIPTILKPRPSPPLYIKLLIYLKELVLFPYYSMKLLANNKLHKNELNPFTRNAPSSGHTFVQFTKRYDFAKLHEVNRHFRISFNDLMLSIISSAITKYAKLSCREYNRLVCAIPIGVKNLPKTARDVSFKNEILGAITLLPSIDDPIKECQKIANETKQTVKNSANISAWKYLEFFSTHFMPYYFQKVVALHVSSSCDLAVTNLPGPAKEVFYCGSPVEDIIPMMSVGVGKAFIIVGTYNNQVRITVNLDSLVKIDLDTLIKILDEKLQYACESMKVLDSF